MLATYPEQTTYPYVRANTFKVREEQRQWLSDLYDKWPLPVGTELANTSAERIRNMINAPERFDPALRETFERAGIIGKRLEYQVFRDLAKNGNPVNVRQYHYTLMLPREEGLQAFDNLWTERLTAMNHAPAPRAKPAPKANGHAHVEADAVVEVAANQTAAALTFRGRYPAATTSAEPLPQNEKPDLGPRRVIPASTTPYSLRQPTEPTAEQRAEFKRSELARVADLQEAAIQRSENEQPVAIATSEAEEVRAIAGPEPTKATEALRVHRKSDDAEAAFEAARQYVDRFKPVNDLIETLTKQGVQVDREAMLAAVHFQRDEFMENLALVLPYVNRLEQTLSRVADENVELRRRLGNYDKMSRDNASMTETNKRLVSENSRLRTELSLRPPAQR